MLKQEPSLVQLASGNDRSTPIALNSLRIGSGAVLEAMALVSGQAIAGFGPTASISFPDGSSSGPDGCRGPVASQRCGYAELPATELACDRAMRRGWRFEIPPSDIPSERCMKSSQVEQHLLGRPRSTDPPLLVPKVAGRVRVALEGGVSKLAARREKREVGGGVVRAVAVDVGDDFLEVEVSPEMRFEDETMLAHVPPSVCAWMLRKEAQMVAVPVDREPSGWHVLAGW